MRRQSRRQRVQDFVAVRGWQSVGRLEWDELKAALPDVSESTIRSSGVSIAQPWLGVRQHTMEELEDSLRQMTEVYVAQSDLRRYCRDQVIGAKAQARFISSNQRVEENKRRLKAEMVEWMLVWLDDPAMFPTWAAMRRQQLANS